MPTAINRYSVVDSRIFANDFNATTTFLFVDFNCGI